MKQIILLPMLCCIFASPVGAANIDQRANESRAAIKEFMGSLKGELKAALKEGGPVKAINACNAKAPAITMAQSSKRGWQIGRTSLKLRNPDNAPDAWEKSVLEKFEARKAAGEDPKKMEHYEVVTQDGKQLFRYMKANSHCREAMLGLPWWKNSA